MLVEHIILVFYQQSAWFISLKTTETCGPPPFALKNSFYDKIFTGKDEGNIMSKTFVLFCFRFCFCFCFLFFHFLGHVLNILSLVNVFSCYQPNFMNISIDIGTENGYEPQELFRCFSNSAIFRQYNR